MASSACLKLGVNLTSVLFKTIQEIPDELQREALACLVCVDRTEIKTGVVAIAMVYGHNSVTLEVGCKREDGGIATGCNICPYLPKSSGGQQ